MAARIGEIKAKKAWRREREDLLAQVEEYKKKMGELEVVVAQLSVEKTHLTA